MGKLDVFLVASERRIRPDATLPYIIRGSAAFTYSSAVHILRITGQYIVNFNRFGHPFCQNIIIL
jgi:hypothetical protein